MYASVQSDIWLVASFTHNVDLRICGRAAVIDCRLHLRSRNDTCFAERSFQKIVLQRQLSDLGMQRLHVVRGKRVMIGRGQREGVAAEFLRDVLAGGPLGVQSAVGETPAAR
jgi:hypothetical protein